MDKRTARAAARRDRSGCRGPASALLDGVRELGPVRCVAAYDSYRDEPATHDTVAALLAAGVTVLLPRREGERLAWVAIDERTRFDTSTTGFREPRGADAGLAAADVVLVPALALTRGGDRLGQGGGFYDRALADLRRDDDAGPRLVGVAYAHEIVDLPGWDVEPHDIRVDGVIAVPCMAHDHSAGSPRSQPPGPTALPGN